MSWCCGHFGSASCGAASLAPSLSESPDCCILGCKAEAENGMGGVLQDPGLAEKECRSHEGEGERPYLTVFNETALLDNLSLCVSL